MLLETRIPFSYIFKQAWLDLLNVFAISAAIDVLVSHNKEDVPPIQAAIPAFLGTAISLLISFKLSQSYDRWWEARKVWGAIVNDSRSLVIQSQSFTAKGNEGAIRKIAFRQIAWCYSLGQSLRGLNPTGNLNPFISSEDLGEIELHNNKPLALLSLHGADIRALKETGQLDVISQVQLDNTL